MGLLELLATWQNVRAAAVSKSFPPAASGGDLQWCKRRQRGETSEQRLFARVFLVLPVVIICRWTMDVNVNTLLREPEILARVFLLLDQRDLRAVEQVCHAW